MANTFPDYELINKGGISLSANFELLKEAPLDARLVVPTLEGLAHLIEGKAAYAGMIAYVTSEKKHYQVNADGSYRQFGLTTEEINDIITDATTAAMEFKGATATLPESGVKGDMYKVSASFEVAAENDAQGAGFTTKVGDSVVYDGEKWYLIPSGDDIEDTWRPVTDVANDASLTFVDGDKIDAVVAENGTIKFNHEKLSAAPADIATEDDKKTRTYLTAVEVDEFGHVTNYKTATENVEDTDTTYEFECQVEEGHSNVHFSVKASDAEQAQEICLDAYTRNETDGKISDAVKVVTDAIATDRAVWDLAGTAVQNSDFEAFESANTEAINAAKKAGEDAAAAVDQKLTQYSEAHASDYTNEQIDNAISTATGNLGSMSTKDANDYFTKEEVNNANAVVLSEAQKYADAKEHKDTTYTIAPTETALEFTVTSSEGDAKTVTLVAPDTGVMSVEAGNDIVVTPGENGKVTIAHEAFTTGTYEKNPESSDKTGDVYMMTAVTVDNGHVTGANVQSLAHALQAMTFIFDGGNSTN